MHARRGHEFPTGELRSRGRMGKAKNIVVDCRLWRIFNSDRYCGSVGRRRVLDEQLVLHEHALLGGHVAVRILRLLFLMLGDVVRVGVPPKE